jgi:phosphoadenosine phosphosulfate reductase
LHAPEFSDSELAALNRGFEDAPAQAVIEWAIEQFHPFMCLAASMTDAVVIDLAVAVEPSIEVVFIDTRYHFAETLETMERVRRHYGLNLRVLTVAPQPVELWEVDPVNCCSAAKVAQLDRALVGKMAWMSGLRRVEAASRAGTPIVARDLRGLIKVNPIATWTDQDVRGYIADHEVPFNPLLERGYPSIGCRPCTQPIDTSSDPRSGRWVGQDKTECGLHL